MYTLVENSSYNFEILTSKIPDSNKYKEVISKRHKIFRKSKVHFSVSPNRMQLFISYVYQLFWIIKYRIKTKSPLIISNGEVVLNSLIIILGKILNFKVIPISYAEEITVPLKNKNFASKIKLFLLKFSYPKAFKHISCCHFVRDLLVDKIKINVKNTKVIPIAFSNEKVSDNNSKKINNSQNILSVGRLVERKGFIELINVVKKLIKEFPLIQLNIVGHGPLEGKIKKVINEQKLDAFIHFHGKVNDKKLHELYLQSDLFILAHRMLKNGDTEGSPVTFAEAGLYNLPSIGGINSGASTIINHNETGLIIDMNDNEIIINSIKKLFSNRATMEKMGQSARKKILADHSPDKIGNEFSNYLNKILD